MVQTSAYMNINESVCALFCHIKLNANFRELLWRHKSPQMILLCFKNMSILQKQNIQNVDTNSKWFFVECMYVCSAHHNIVIEMMGSLRLLLLIHYKQWPFGQTSDCLTILIRLKL